MDRQPKKLIVPDEPDPEIEQFLLDLVLDGDMNSLYDPVRRDLILVAPGESVFLYDNEQN